MAEKNRKNAERETKRNKEAERKLWGKGERDMMKIDEVEAEMVAGKRGETDAKE